MSFPSKEPQDLADAERVVYSYLGVVEDDTDGRRCG
jgi:hypothetical protein